MPVRSSWYSTGVNVTPAFFEVVQRLVVDLLTVALHLVEARLEHSHFHAFQQPLRLPVERIGAHRAVVPVRPVDGNQNQHFIQNLYRTRISLRFSMVKT